MVPLHGRLFAQWMHHVYPRECPYPHLSGTVENMNPTEFKVQSSDVSATKEEMREYVMQSENATEGYADDLAVEDVSPWTPEEELFVSRPQLLSVAEDHAASIPAAFRSAALLAASGSLALGLIRTMKVPVGEDLPAKYMV